MIGLGQAMETSFDRSMAPTVGAMADGAAGQAAHCPRCDDRAAGPASGGATDCAACVALCLLCAVAVPEDVVVDRLAGSVHLRPGTVTPAKTASRAPPGRPPSGA